ncbi:type VI secretion protein [Streptomyces sp. Act143]|uniref:type IV secretory system conjugative DNA transfer family protein n=1 Tax=Streptomyces sp. Act143 TaxID=2200760 RepID=UPI000D679407|nr:type IV secretory system conjugative DNA transfer family protein [Streptomyces sp. Act143]PWI20599.1 type VI secretion protein [Streptomyces sp. Act143]
MRPDDRRRQEGQGQGGIPDGLLVGILAFLIGMTLLVWSATGLAGWFAHGAWPDGVTFTRTPPAMRQLIGQPHDMPGAWPDTPAGQLSGYGLFWGLFIGQLMVLVVLTVFVLGTVARWKAVRRARKAAPPVTPRVAVAAVEEQPPVAPQPVVERVTHHEVPTPRAEPVPAPLPAPMAVPQRVEKVLVAPRETRHTTATQAVRDAEGPTLVVTSNPAIWSDTKDARAKLGPVHLYDPTHLCDTPARLHWSPTAGCEDRQTAKARAAALLTPVRPTARLDQAVSDTAETLLRSYLHAAAIDGRTIRHVHRWSQGTQIQDAVRILRTNPKAAPGAAGELEATLTAHPERRDIAQELTGRALSALFTVNIREACTPNRTDALALDSFVGEGGTLYVVGESIEDPRTNPGAMPLLTALVSSVVERGRHMAERSSSGRLDPPLTLVLDDIAAVAPLPQLPELLATGADRGLPTLALLRSREQARSRWPHDELPV